MFRIDTDGSVNGSFSEGNPSLGIVGTRVSADWLNDVQETIAYVIEAAGLSLVKGNYTLLANAILTLVGGGTSFEKLTQRITNLNASYLFGASQVIRSITEPVNNPSNPFKDNDIWYNPVTGETFVWNTLTDTWVNTSSIQGGQAIIALEKARAISDGTVDIYLQETPPVGATEGDIWYDQRNKLLYFLTNGQWVQVTDKYTFDTIVNSIIGKAANTAKGIADSKIRTYWQTTQPTGLTSLDDGDLWFDTDDNNKIYRYIHPSWVVAADANIAKAFDLLFLQTSIADGSIQVYFFPVQPTAENQESLTPPNLAPSEGDIWIDVSENSENVAKNDVYLYISGIWILQTDPVIKKYLLSFANAAATADGSVTVYYSETPPDDTFRPKPRYGDIWFNTSLITIPDASQEVDEEGDLPTIQTPKLTQYRYDESQTNVSQSDDGMGNLVNDDGYGTHWIPIKDFTVKIIEANIKKTQKTIADATTALSSDLTELTTQVGNNIADIQQSMVSINGIATSYGVITNVNNKVVGFGYLTDFEGTIEFTPGLGALTFRPGDQIFAGSTWETKTYSAVIVTVDNVNHTMKVISQTGTYVDGMTFRVRDNLNAVAVADNYIVNPTPGTSEFDIMIDKFRISDGTSSYIPFSIVGGVVYIGVVDTSIPVMNFIGVYSTAPGTNFAINSIYKNSTNGSTYILQYVTGNSGSKHWVLYLESGTTAKLLNITSNIPYFTFSSDLSTDPLNDKIIFRVAYQGLSTAVDSGDITILDSDGDPVTVTLTDVVSDDTVTQGTHDGSFTFSLAYTEVDAVSFPLSINVANGALSDVVSVYVLIGSTSKLISITPDAYFYLFEDDAATVPQNTSISFKIKHQNLSSAPTSGNLTVVDSAATAITFSNYVAAGTGTGVSTFDILYEDAEFAVFPLIVTVSDEDVNDVVTIRTLIGGSDAITGLLTNESHTVAADEAGDLIAGALDDASGSFMVFKGTSNQSSACTFEVFSATGATATIDNTGTSTAGNYQITALSANQATVVFQATYGGVPIKKTMSLAKSIAGVNARELKLTSDSQTFNYDGDNAPKDSGQLITFVARYRRLATPTFTALDQDGDPITLTSVGSTANSLTKSLSIANFGASAYVTVTVTQTYDGITYSDTITVVRLVDGSRALVVVVSNENHTFFSNQYGVIDSGDFAAGNTVISVYRGTDLVTYSAGGEEGSYSIGTITPSSGVTMNGALTAPNFGITALGDDIGYFDIPIIYHDPVVSGASTTITKRISYSKVRQGFDAHYLRLTTTAQTFEFDGDNNYINGSASITFLAVHQGMSDIAFTVKDQSNNNLTVTGTGNTRVLTISNFGKTATRAIVTVSGTYVDLNGDTQTLTDQITIVKLRGQNAPIGIILTNESHTFSATSDGTVDPSKWTEGNCNIRVFRNDIELTYNSNNTVANTFAIVSVTATGVTRNTSLTAPLLGINAMSADSGSLVVVLSYTDSTGTVQGTTFTRQISYARAKTGTSAPSLNLNTSANYFVFDTYGKANNNSDVITFTATPILLGGTPTWTAVDNNGSAVTLTVAGGALSATLAVTAVASTSITSITVRAQIDIVVNGQTQSYFDVITIPKLTLGGDAITVLIENDNQSLAATEDGTVISYADTSTRVRVYRGSTEVSYSGTAANNTFRFGTITSGMQTNVTYNTGVSAPNVAISAMGSADTGMLAVPIIYQNTIGGTVPLSKIISYVKSRRGAAARNIKLVASSQIFNFDGKNAPVNSSDSITFNAITTSNLGSVTFTAVDQNNNVMTSYLTGTGSSRTLTITNFNQTFSSIPVQSVTITASAQDSGSNTFTDQISVVRLRAGADAVQVVLSNEAHTFYADENNIVIDTYSFGNSTVQVYQGSTLVNYSAVVPQPANTWTFGTLTGTNVTPGTPNVAGVPAIVGITNLANGTSGSPVRTGVLNIPVIFKDAAGASTTVTKQISYTKSKAGTDARSMKLLASSQAFMFEGDGSYAAQTITFDAITAFISGSVVWTAVDNAGNNITLTAGASGAQKLINITNFQTNASTSVTVTASATDALTGVTYSDKITAVRLTNGAAGSNAVQIILSNENHTYAADELGAVSNWTPGNCTVSMYNGSTAVPYSATQQVNSFRFTSFTATNVTRNTSLTLPTVGINAMSDIYGSLQLNIVYTDSANNNIPITRIITYSKSLAGATSHGVRLTSTTSTFAFNGDNSAIDTAATAVFTAYLTNLASITWSAVDNLGTDRSSWLTTTGTNVRTLAITSFLSTTNFVSVSVSGTYNSVTYTDTFKVYRLRSGSDAITVIASNQNHSFIADESGVVSSGSFPSGNSTFTVYRGTTLISYDGAATPASNTWKLGTLVPSNVTPITSTTTSTSATVGIDAFVSSSQDYGTLTVPVNYKNAAGATSAISTVISYSRQRAGRDARWIAINASTQSFNFNGDNQAIDGSQTITFTIAGNGIDLNAATVTAYNDLGASVTLGGSGSTRTMTVSAFAAANFVTVTAGASATINGVTQTVSDTTSVARLKAGSTAIQVLLSNESHTFAASETGSVSSLLGGDCAVSVYRGLTAITQNTTPSAVNGQWRFGTPVTSDGVNITVSIIGDTIRLTKLDVDSGTVTVPIIYTDLQGTGITYNRVISYAKSKEGKAARSLYLYSTSQVFKYTGDNLAVNSSDSITLTAIAVNLSSPTFTAVNELGTTITLTSGSSALEKVLSIANFGNSQWVKITVSQTDNSITYTDIITVVRVREGADNVNVILTNEAHTFDADETGAVSSYTPGNSQVIVYRGATQLSYAASGANTFSFGTPIVSNCTSNGALTAPDIGISALSANSGTLTIPVVVRNSAGASTTYNKIVSYSKSRAGINARNLSLLSSAQQFAYDTTGAAKNSSATITFTAVTSYISEALTFTATNNSAGAVTLTGTGNTRTLSIANFGSASSVTVTVSVTSTVNGVSTPFSDSITVVRVQDGAAGATGATGASGLQVIASNENHTFAADENNSVSSFTSGNSTINLYSGTAQIGYNALGANNTWLIQNIVATGATAIAPTTTSTSAVIGISAMSADQATLVYEVVYTNSSGVASTPISKSITYTKTKAGYSARFLSMSANKQAFTFDQDGVSKISSDTVTFDVTKSSTLGTITFTAVDELGTTITLVSGATAAQKILNLTNFGSSKNVKVTASATDSSGTYTDAITVVRLSDGASAIDVVSSNESHTFSSDENGTISSYVSGDSTFTVYRGATLVNYNAAGGANSWRFTSYTGSSITAAINATTATSATLRTSAMTSDTATVPVVVAYTDSVGSITSITKLLSYSKARAGIVARSLSIVSTGQTFRFDDQGQPVTAGDTITFTGLGYNISGPFSWTAVNELGTTIKSNGSANSLSLSITEFSTSLRVVVTATTSATINGSVVNFSDSMTVYRLADAQDAYQIVLSNESHTFDANDDGYVADYSGGDCVIKVYRGLELITAAASAGTNVWWISAVSAVNVTQDSTLSAPNVGISMMSADSGYLDVTISYRDNANVTSTATKRISYSKVTSGSKVDGITISQSNQSTVFSTDKNGGLLAGVNYGMGDSTLSVFNGDLALTYGTIAGEVNTYLVTNVTATNVTRNNGLSAPTYGISAMSADTGSLALTVVPYVARTALVNSGFESGTAGGTTSVYGWVVSSANPNGIGLTTTVDAASTYQSQLSYGAATSTQFSGSGCPDWYVSKRFATRQATSVTIRAMVRAGGTVSKGTFSGTSTQTHANQTDCYYQVICYNSSGTVVATLSSRTLSHYRYFDLNIASSYSNTWVPFERTITGIPGTTTVISVRLVSASTSAASTQTVGYFSTGITSPILWDDVKITSNGSLYDTTVNPSYSVRINYARARTGQDATLYYIKSTNGTAFLNGQGSNLTGELHLISGLSDTLVSGSGLNSSSIQLYKNNSGTSTPFSPRATSYSLSPADVSGSLLIEARAGDGGTILDTISLFDVNDGLPGGYVAADSLTLNQINSEVYAFSPASTGLTGTFYGVGNPTPYTSKVTITGSFSGSTPRLSWAQTTSNAQIAVAVTIQSGAAATVNTTYNDAISMTVKFTFTDPSTGRTTVVTETVYRTTSGTRGSRHFYATGTSWSDSVADNAITAQGNVKVSNDLVTISSSSPPFSQTKFWNAYANAGAGAWQTVAQVIDGNLVVQGTLGADRIASGLIQTALLTIGADQKMTIDASSNAIIVRDQNNVERVRLGKLGTNNYGITIYNAAGAVILSSGSGVNWTTGLTGVPSNISSLSGSESILNNSITVNGSGQLTGIGSSGVVVDNTKQAWTDVQNRPTTIAALDSAAGTQLNQLLLGSPPPGISLGGSGNFVFTPNTNAAGAGAAATIRIVGSKLYHPKLGAVTSFLGGTPIGLNTTFFGTYQAGVKAFLIYTQTSASTRFGAGNGFENYNWFIARYYWETAAWNALSPTGYQVVFTPVDTDCICAAFYKNNTDTQITSLAAYTSYNSNLPADGATVGATSGVNLTSPSLGTLSDSNIVTSQGTSADSATQGYANAIINSDYTIFNSTSGEVFGWALGTGHNTGQTVTRNINLSGFSGARNVLYGFTSGTPANGTYFEHYYMASSFDLTNAKKYGLPVYDGQRVFLSIYAAYYRATSVQLNYAFLDKNGSVLVASTVAAGGLSGGAVDGNLSNFTRIGGFVTAPTNARYLTMWTRLICNGQPNPYIFVTAPMACVVTAGTTAWPAYTPGPVNASQTGTSLYDASGALLSDSNIKNQVLQDALTSGSVRPLYVYNQGFWATLNSAINSGNISTYISSAAIGSAYIADVAASKITTDTLNANLTIGVGGTINIDGPNKRITVGSGITIDGVNSRIVISD